MSLLEREIINMLADMEMDVGKLYKIYATKYSEHREFWETLVKEEENHARLIMELGGLVRDGVVRLNTKRCNKKSIEAVMGYVRKQLKRAEKRTIAWRDALTASLQIEKNVIEKDFCSFFEGNAPEFEQACQTITNETAQHRDKIRQLLERA
jgi:hypothetical protein